MPNVQLFNEYSAEDQAIARRRKMAEMLQQQSMTPLESQTAGGWVVPTSPMAGLAKLLQGYTSGKMTSAADEQQKALGQRYQTEGASALAKGLREWRGSPETSPNLSAGQTVQMDDQGAPPPPNIPAQAPDQNAAMVTFGSHPMTQPLNTGIMAKLLKEEETKAYKPGDVLYRGNKQVGAIPSSPKEHVIGGKVYESGAGGLKDLGGPGEGNWSEPYNLNGAMVQRNTSTGQIKQAVNREPQTHIYNPPAVTTAVVQDPSNPGRQLTVDARTYRGGSLGAPGVVGVSGKLGDAAKVEQKLSVEKPQAKLRVDTMIQNMDKLDTAIKELNKDPGLPNITGTFYGRTPNVTNTATGAQAQLDSIKSQIFVSALQAMREASKTGGAVGNVSDREGDKLEATLAALNQAQGTPAFKAQLAKAIQQIDVSKTLLRSAYDEQYGGIPDFQGVERRKPSGSWDESKEARYQELKRKQNASQ